MIRRDSEQTERFNSNLSHGRAMSHGRYATARAALLCAIVGLMLVILGCDATTPVSPVYHPRPMQPVPAQKQVVQQQIVLPAITSIRSEPVIRVRIDKGQTRANLSSPSGLMVGPADPNLNTAARHYPTAVAVTLYQGAFLITDTNRQSIRWALPELLISPAATGQLVTFNGKTYPGSIALVPSKNGNGVPTGGLDVVNHVGMESYLPGVVERELYGSWEPTTFRAAAIAARTYAIFEASMSADKHFDLESTTASQAYSGQATNPKAVSAVAQTRGLLIEYQGRIVPAFYSSSCGGTGQDAVSAFTWLPGLPDIAPLRGQNHGPYCNKSTKFRWGPITRNKSTLEARMRAWGESEGHPIKSLRGLRDIRITKTNAVGRPTQFTITDNAGLMYTLGPEQFRFACNNSATGIGAVPREQSLNSSHVQVSVGASTVTFHDGRGYGHGVGLCQFGAQALAQAGYNEYSILSFYYPGSRVVRAYR